MTDDAVFEEAEQMVRYMRAIRSMLKYAEDEDLTTSNLSVPQVDLLKLLNASDGQSLKELSAQLGLAHSTVSGIVDRLEKRQLIQRRPDPDDKRFVRIFLDPQVTEYVNKTVVARRSSILVKVLATLPPDERQQILDSLGELYTLLKEHE
jgi:DNA-binding MarR family transcriptional regulator